MSSSSLRAIRTVVEDWTKAACAGRTDIPFGAGFSASGRLSFREALAVLMQGDLSQGSFVYNLIDYLVYKGS